MDLQRVDDQAGERDTNNIWLGRFAGQADTSDAEKTAYQGRLQRWAEASRLGKITHDGSRARTRFHHGLVAQEVAAVIAQTGVDFGGYQDHAIKGGDDVLSLGYAEFIAPLIKAVQELAAQDDQLAAHNIELVGENASILARLAKVEEATSLQSEE